MKIGFSLSARSGSGVRYPPTLYQWTALTAIREARSNLELLAKLLGELDERPTVNVLLSSEWLELRAVIVGALEPYSEVREAVLRAIGGVGSGSSAR